MKKLLLLFFSLAAFFLWPENVLASVNCNLNTNPSSPLLSPDTVTFTFDKTIVQNEVNKYPSGGTLFFNFPQAEAQCGQTFINLHVTASNPSLTVSDPNTNWCAAAVLGEGTRGVELIYTYGGNRIQICDTTNFEVKKFNSSAAGSCDIVADYNHDGIPPEGDVDDTSWKVSITNIQPKLFQYSGVSLRLPIIIDYDGSSGGNTGSFGWFNPSSLFSITNISSLQENIPDNVKKAGDHIVNVYATDIDANNLLKYLGPQFFLVVFLNNPVIFTNQSDILKKDVLMCSATFEIAPRGATPKPTQIPSPTPTIPALCKQAPCNSGSCSGDCFVCPKCPGFNQVKLVPELRPICDNIDKKYRDTCKKCHADGSHIWTAIGCVPTDIWIIIKDYLFNTGMGIAGAISFLYFLYGCFLVLTSAGNPEKIEEAKQIIVSALSGLLLIIFSVFILRVISVDILKLPGFS